MARKLILYISSTLDGFIAGPNDDLSFLEPMAKEGEDYGYADFVSGIDTVIIGRRTYDWVMAQGVESYHADKEVYVITRSEKSSEGKLTYYSGDLAQLVVGLKQESGKDIYCDGGAQLVKSLLEADLLDEIILSVVPVILGDGIRLFPEGIDSKNLELIGTKSYSTGMVQLHYRFKQ